MRMDVTSTLRVQSYASALIYSEKYVTSEIVVNLPILMSEGWWYAIA